MKATAETMLVIWGAWQRGNKSIGIPSMNIIYRIMKEGTGASHSSYGEPHMSKTVEITENCVLTMPKHVQRAVKHRYIGDEPDEIACRKLRCSSDEYAYRINCAVHILKNYLTEN